MLIPLLLNKAIFGNIKKINAEQKSTHGLILAVLFQSSRETGFYDTFSSPWEGGPEYRSTNLQLFIDSEI